MELSKHKFIKGLENGIVKSRTNGSIYISYSLIVENILNDPFFAPAKK